LVIIPILSGYLTDRYFHSKGRVLIKLMIAVMVTACLFLSLAGIFFTHAQTIYSYIPLLMLVWVISMNMFYNPGLSLLAQTARQSGWAYASAVTGSVTDVVFSIVGFLIIFFRSLGHIYTFGAGALLVLVASIYFYSSHKYDQTSDGEKEVPKTKLNWENYLSTFMVGLGLGFIHYRIVHHLAEHTYGIEGQIVVPAMMVGCSLLLFGFHNRLHNFNLLRLFISGFILCLMAYFIIMFTHGLTGTITGLLILFPGILCVTGSAFGAALDRVPPAWSNFGTGVFLAGFNSMIYFIS
ncbi:MAG: hypothetical protein ABIO44_08990, partial [Saprospiraceae bacterium]